MKISNHDILVKNIEYVLNRGYNYKNYFSIFTYLGYGESPEEIHVSLLSFTKDNVLVDKIIGLINRNCEIKDFEQSLREILEESEL